MTIHTRLDATKTLVLEHPYNPERLRFDNPNVSFPAVLTPEVLDQFNIVEIVEVEAPVADAVTRVEEREPVRDNGNVWTQQWITLSIDPSVDNERLNIQRDRLWIRVKNTRSKRLEQGNVCVDGDWYAVDLMSRSKYVTLLNKAAHVKGAQTVLKSAGAEVEWRLVDNRTCHMTVQRIKDLTEAIEVFDTETFAYAAALKETVYNSTSPATVDITTGWPKIYGE